MPALLLLLIHHSSFIIHHSERGVPCRSPASGPRNYGSKSTPQLPVLRRGQTGYFRPRLRLSPQQHERTMTIRTTTPTGTTPTGTTTPTTGTAAVTTETAEQACRDLNLTGLAPMLEELCALTVAPDLLVLKGSCESYLAAEVLQPFLHMLGSITSPARDEMPIRRVEDFAALLQKRHVERHLGAIARAAEQNAGAGVH